MAEHVEIHYESLQRIAALFADRSEDVERMANRIRNQVEELEAGGWIGQGANAFYSEMVEDILPAINRLVRALQEADDTVRHIMQEFRTAEVESRSVWDPF